MVLSDPQSEPGRIVTSTSRLRVGLGAAIVLVIVAVAVAVLASMLGSSGVDRSVAGGTDPAGIATPGTDADEPVPAAPNTASVLVHLLGAVNAPGLYELRTGDRIIDAVAAAGGFTDDAEQGGVNLARQVSDGEQIYVPRVGEVPPGGVDGGALAGEAGGSAGTPSTGGTVNLNTASREQLETLPGVGPVTAAAILDWRETNGRFSAVEDLLSVSGIGQKTFAALEDLVSV